MLKLSVSVQNWTQNTMGAFALGFTAVKEFALTVADNMLHPLQKQLPSS